MDLTEMQKKLSIWKEENEDDYGYNDFFTTQEMHDDKKKERVETLPLDKLVTFKNHPFKAMGTSKNSKHKSYSTINCLFSRKKPRNNAIIPTFFTKKTLISSE